MVTVIKKRFIKSGGNELYFLNRSITRDLNYCMLLYGGYFFICMELYICGLEFIMLGKKCEILVCGYFEKWLLFNTDKIKKGLSPF